MVDGREELNKEEENRSTCVHTKLQVELSLLGKACTREDDRSEELPIPDRYSQALAAVLLAELWNA